MCALGVIWGGEGAILVNEDQEIQMDCAAEGAPHLFVDNLAIPKTASHVKNAHLFMNFILRPDISAKISDAFRALNPNTAARASSDARATRQSRELPDSGRAGDYANLQRTSVNRPRRSTNS